MFAILYDLGDGREFKIYDKVEDAQSAAKNIASTGAEVTIFDYDITAERFMEFYTI